MTQGLLLDIGGVVLAGGVVLSRRLAEREPAVAAALGGFGGIGSAGDELWQRMLRREVTERDYWAQRAAGLGAALGETWGTRDLITRLYAAPDREWLQPAVVELMTDVKAAGMPLAALSNDLADFHGPDWAGRQDCFKLFDVIIDGSVTGVLKPDPRAYQAAVEALALPAGQIVFLDDMPWNVAGGRAAGLVAFQVSHDNPSAAVDAARHQLGLSPRAARPTGPEE